MRFFQLLVTLEKNTNHPSNSREENSIILGIYFGSASNALSMIQEEGKKYKLEPLELKEKQIIEVLVIIDNHFHCI